GSRDATVTGVQTCALPISPSAINSPVRRSSHLLSQRPQRAPRKSRLPALDVIEQRLFGAPSMIANTSPGSRPADPSESPWAQHRSEERRVGKEGNQRVAEK